MKHFQIVLQELGPFKSLLFGNHLKFQIPLIDFQASQFFSFFASSSPKWKLLIIFGMASEFQSCAFKSLFSFKNFGLRPTNTQSSWLFSLLTCNFHRSDIQSCTRKTIWLLFYTILIGHCFTQSTCESHRKFTWMIAGYCKRINQSNQSFYCNY